MPLKIADGLGSGIEARVDTENRLRTNAIDYIPLQAYSLLGRAYCISTALITLTTANESALFYVENTDPTYKLLLHGLCLSLGRSTGGNPGSAVLQSYYGSTGGTLISGATSAVVTCLNLGVSTPPAAKIYQGVEGSTQTGGVARSVRLFPDGGYYPVQLEKTLQTGNRVVFTVTPPASNTSMKVSIVAGFTLNMP
jgi:hypothetical protein